MEIKNWKKMNEELVYDGYRKILRKTFILPDNRREDFDIVIGEDYVGILALTTSNNIILVKQFRPGTEEIYNEIPAGFINENENPLETAIRELSEETGYTGDFEFIGSCPKGAYSNFYGYCFVAKNCKRTHKTKHDKNEFIEVIEKSLEDFKKQLRASKLTNIDLVYMALDYLKLL